MIHRISAQEIPNVLNSAKPKKPSLVTSNFSDSSSNKNSRLADHRITSLRSEASSCNSHTALMPTLKRNGSQKRGINGRRMFLTAFPCFDKKDVCINHHQLPTRARSQSLVKQQREEEEIEIDLEESRNSIEVFGSGSGATLMKGEVAKNMERKLSMLTWDAIPRARNIPDGDDVASDASSDLFEIETISGAAHPVTVADDAASLCTSPASRYAPSEASIQWIVVTDETAAGDVRGCEAHECRRGRILGCRSLKAVELAQNVASKTVSSGKLQLAL